MVYVLTVGVSRSHQPLRSLWTLCSRSMSFRRSTMLIRALCVLICELGMVCVLTVGVSRSRQPLRSFPMHLSLLEKFKKDIKFAEVQKMVSVRKWCM